MIFVSYSSKDNIEAYQIVEYLEKNGIPCWIAPRNIRPGTSYPSQIVKAIRECSGFILVASKNVNLSNHINSEVARAFDHKKIIFPFLIEKMEFSDDFIYYLGQIQWINAYDSFEKGLSALQKSISINTKLLTDIKMPASPKFERSDKSKAKTTRIVTYQDLIDIGMDALDIANRLVENDYELYPDMVVDNEGTPEQWAEYLSTYPETFRYLINDENEIVGNWSFLAVSEEKHSEMLANGELTESTFNIDETEFLLFPGDYVGYLLNLSVNKGYNNAKNINLLVKAFGEQLLSFAEEGIFFKEWYVNVFRKDHEAMYKRMGFSFLVNNKTFGKVYYLDCTMIPKQSNLSKTSRLLEIYNEHFA